MLLFGLALMVGGVGVLVWVRGELAFRVPILDAIADRVQRMEPAARWVVRAAGLPPLPRPAARRPPRQPRGPEPALGWAAPPDHTVVRPATRAVGRASPPQSSLVRRP